LKTRGGHESEVPELTPAGSAFFFRSRSQNFVKNRIRDHFSIATLTYIRPIYTELFTY